MRIHQLALCLIAGVALSDAKAECTVNGNTGNCRGTLKSMEVGDVSFTLIEVNSSGQETLPCTRVAGYWRVDRNSPVYPEWYQAFVLALATNANVIFTIKPSPSPASPCELARIAYQN